jgi:predicted amidohydrolase
VRPIEHSTQALQNCEQLRLILVQAASPFNGEPAELELQDNVRGAQFHWRKAEHIEERKSKAQAVLAQLKAQGFLGSMVSVICFPEYSLPKQFHSGLQLFANENNCIIIPGTYYEDEGIPSDPYFRQNVCVIYQPNADPLVIVKKNGFRDEQAALAVNDVLPNIVHLRGSNAAIGPFSISVFICRDYLAPFQGTEQGHVSLLDLDSPGINLVVMCSSQRSLFEGRAALDLRGLAGSRRLVAFCNCAGAGIEKQSASGSAILGPKERSSDTIGDVIEALSGDDEGVIIADVQLSHKDFARIEMKPDKTVFVPIKSAFRFVTLYEQGADGPHVSFRKQKESSLVERGVWHPAFLDHIERKIVLHFFTTRRVKQVKEAIDNKQIRHVSALAVEGKYDILLRYYKSSASGKSFLETNYTKLSKPQFERYFISDREAIIVVEPSNIIKYRTIAVPPRGGDGAQAWEERAKKIRELVPKRFGRGRRRRALEIASQLANNWNHDRVTDEERQRLSPIFFEMQETIFSTDAYESGRNRLREKFVLIAVDNSIEKLKLMVVDRWLLTTTRGALDLPNQSTGRRSKV